MTKTKQGCEGMIQEFHVRKHCGHEVLTSALLELVSYGTLKAEDAKGKWKCGDCGAMFTISEKENIKCQEKL